MGTATKIQGTITLSDQDTNLEIWINAFLVDRKAQNLAKGTQDFYRKKLNLFNEFCFNQAIKSITQITPDDIRGYLLYLVNHSHNPGGVHAAYRALRAFLFWWEEEIEPEGWRNPIRKVKAPKVPEEQLEPLNLDDLRAMLETCDKSFGGIRDRAIMLCLLDTGCRAAEFLALTLEDVNLTTGACQIRQGKGRKPRTAFLGKKSRKVIRKYLSAIENDHRSIWRANSGELLTYSGLRAILQRRAKQAGLAEAPELHSFRRAFVLAMMRAGVDIYRIQEIVGHADIQILRRYLKYDDTDRAAAHQKGSPVDHANL